MMSKISKQGKEIMNLILATDHEEFFYEANHEPVPEGEPVGVDWDHGDRVELVLFDNIYFQQENYVNFI